MEPPSLLLRLPFELQVELALRLPLVAVVNYCQVNTYLNETFCQNEEFWRARFLQDYGRPDREPTSWRQLYRMTYTGQLVWSFGDGEFGKLGLDDTDDYFIPEAIDDFKGVAVSAGLSHSLVLDTDGRVWAFGSNSHGQLGLDDEIKWTDRPLPIPNLNAKAISAGWNHSLIIDRQNNLVAFGDNSYGQAPRSFNGSFKVKAISAGWNHSLVIDRQNNLWVFGSNQRGQLGLGETISRQDEPTQIPGLKVKAISAANHSLVIDDRDNLITFGDNEFGQLGLGDRVDRFTPTTVTELKGKTKAISAGGLHSLVIDHQNNLWSFGQNKEGQLGFLSDGVVWSPHLVETSYKVKKISAGYEHSLLIDFDNQIRAFGDNSDGQLGLGDRIIRKVIPQVIPGFRGQEISAGVDHSLIVGSLNL